MPSRTSFYRALSLPLLAAFLLPAALRAQGGEGQLPPLQIEDVTVIGKKSVALPKSRKGEVTDTTRYVLPAGDSLALGPRVSSLTGSGGELPRYREGERPLHARAEFSIGTFVSPHLRLGGEWIEPRWDLGAHIDYRGTTGFRDSTEASALGFDAGASVLLGDNTSPFGTMRLRAGVERLGENYILYGNTAAPYDRSRSFTSFALDLAREDAGAFTYRMRLEYASTALDDRIVDTIPSVSAAEPRLLLEVGAPIDSAFSVQGRVAFGSTSLQYALPTTSLASTLLEAGMQWKVSPELSVAAGAGFASAGASDSSGTHSLFLYHLVGRYALSPELALSGGISSEMRDARYRERLLAAPYVDREIVLVPERVPLRLTAGGEYRSELFSAGGNLLFEASEGTPVVVRDSVPGALRYAATSTTSIGLELNAASRLTEQIELRGEARIRSARDTAERHVPMLPSFELGLQGRYHLTDAITLGADLRGIGARAVSFDPTAEMLPAMMLLDLNGEWKLQSHIALTAAVNNLLASKPMLWDNYVGQGLELRVGARFDFNNQ